MSQLAFFGSRHAFDYRNIGGTDSLVRRLAYAVAQRDHAVDLVTYGHARPAVEEHEQGVCSVHVRSWSDVLPVLAEYDHVVTIYLPPHDRLAFARFRRQYGQRIRFHMLYLGWPEVWFKRQLAFLDSVLFPFNGCLFGVSPRLVNRLKRIDPEARLLWPPVPSDYFAPLPLKADSKRIRVTFLGRVDPGKGVIETLEVFNALSNYPDVELLFCGMHWPHDSNSVYLHKALLAQEQFRYVHVNFDRYTEATDEMVQSTLANTDILLQPYRRLSSTIDTPLLILEAMASLTPVITRPFGDIPRIYGPSPCLLAGQDVVGKVVDLVLSARSWLAAERERIHQQNKVIHFDLDSVVNVFCDALGLC